MNKKAMEGLKKEEEIKGQIDDLKKSIRHLEIELDYIENKEPHNYKYIRLLEKQIDEMYDMLDVLDES